MAVARIYKPARTAMQSGTAKTKEWVLEFEPEQSREVEPLMGWTSSGDMRQQVRLQFDARVPLLEYIKRIQEEGAIPLRDLIGSRAGDPLWSGDRAVLAYSASWTLVHYLLHGSRGRYRTAFGEYARLEAQGEGGVEAFTRLFGPDLRPLEDSWHEYESDL